MLVGNFNPDQPDQKRSVTLTLFIPLLMLSLFHDVIADSLHCHNVFGALRFEYTPGFTFENVSNHCYYHQNGRLVVPKTDEEVKIVSNIAFNFRTSVSRTGFVGAFYNRELRMYQWSDGDKFREQSAWWAPFEPGSDGIRKSFVIITSDDGGSFKDTELEDEGDTIAICEWCLSYDKFEQAGQKPCLCSDGFLWKVDRVTLGCTEGCSKLTPGKTCYELQSCPSETCPRNDDSDPESNCSCITKNSCDSPYAMCMLGDAVSDVEVVNCTATVVEVPTEEFHVHPSIVAAAAGISVASVTGVCAAVFKSQVFDCLRGLVEGEIVSAGKTAVGGAVGRVFCKKKTQKDDKEEEDGKEENNTEADAEIEEGKQKTKSSEKVEAE